MKLINDLKNNNTLFKYIFSAGASFGIDLLIFTILTLVFKNFNASSKIFLATFIARSFSSVFNYFMNRNVVFKKNDGSVDLTTFIKYYTLVFIQMFSSYFFVLLFFNITKINSSIVKIFIDVIVFGINYIVQKHFIFNNNKKMELKKWFVENKFIVIIILISLFIHILSICQLGFQYGLKSDDLSYINSGITFLNTGVITMHDGLISAQILPGMTYMIAILAMIFGEGIQLWIALKVLWIVFSLLSIYGIYKIVMQFGSHKIISCLVCLFVLTADFIWMDNIILTETPFMLGFIYLIYNTIKLQMTKKWKYFYFIVFWYIFSVLLKANIAIYPIFMIIYLLFKKYDYKILFKQVLIAGGIISLFFIPWTIRNYIHFNAFIPLTYGSGNPLLLGTYQGYGYPINEPKEYEEEIKVLMSEEMKKCYYESECNEKDYMKGYYSLERDGMIAKYRMKQWWENDKESMLKSYLFYKPKTNAINAFYWDTVFDIQKESIMSIRYLEIVLCMVGCIYLLIKKKYVAEILFIAFNYFFQIMVYSYTFAFDRYGQTLIFLRILIIGIALSVLFEQFKNKKQI